MAQRLTLKKLAKKYGIDIKGLTYSQLIQDIVVDNSLRATKKMHQLSDRRMRNAFKESVDMGIINLPEYAIPAITARKAAQQGRMITDTMRNVITRGLRQAVIEHPNDTKAAIDQMQQHIKDTFGTYTTAHAKTIAVTEVRSSVDMTKYLYAQELAARNQGKLHIVKQWVHHDDLVKDPRDNHKAIDGEKVAFESPFSIGLMYPHDPTAPASEVINCQCGYKLLVEEMAVNEVFKDILRIKMGKVSKGAAINPSTGKPYQIGDIKTRPDGTKWVKTGTYSWALADKQDGGQKPQEQKQEEGGQSADDATEIAKKYGNKGLYRLTKGGLLALLEKNGVDNPKSLSWKDKVAKYQEIVSKLEEEKETTIKPKSEGKQEFTKADFHILKNKNFTHPTENVMCLGTKIEFNEDGTISDKSYDELMAKIEPRRGGHWGSAETENEIAPSVALVNASDWKPVDKMENGQLQEYTQHLGEWSYVHRLRDGLALRKYAQEHLKHPDMSRENVPNFFRGMSISRDQFNQLISGEADTIELTGCTAITAYEEIADQYGSSKWTASFGAGRQSVKLVIERDDYLDNSIGMFHPCGGDRLDKNPNKAFEMLTGASSFYVKSIGNKKGTKEDFGKKFEKVGNIDWDYAERLADGKIASHLGSYYADQHHKAQAEAKLRMRKYIEDTKEWTQRFIQDHAQEFFDKYPRNKRRVADDLKDQALAEFANTEMGKKYKELRGSPRSNKLPHLGDFYGRDKKDEEIDEGLSESKDYYDMLVFKNPSDLITEYERTGEWANDIGTYKSLNTNVLDIKPPSMKDYFSKKNIDEMKKKQQKAQEKINKQIDILEKVLPAKVKDVLTDFFKSYDIPQNVKDEYIRAYTDNTDRDNWKARSDATDEVEKYLDNDGANKLYQLKPPSGNIASLYTMGDWEDSPYYVEGIDDIMNKTGGVGKLKEKERTIKNTLNDWDKVPYAEIEKLSSDDEMKKALEDGSSEIYKNMPLVLMRDYYKKLDDYYRKIPTVEVHVVAGRGKKSIKTDDIAEGGQNE